MLKTPSSFAGDAGSIPCWGIKIPHASRPKIERERESLGLAFSLTLSLDPSPRLQKQFGGCGTPLLEATCLPVLDESAHLCTLKATQPQLSFYSEMLVVSLQHSLKNANYFLFRTSYLSWLFQVGQAGNLILWEVSMCAV